MNDYYLPADPDVDPHPEPVAHVLGGAVRLLRPLPDSAELVGDYGERVTVGVLRAKGVDRKPPPCTCGESGETGCRRCCAAHGDNAPWRAPRGSRR